MNINPSYQLRTAMLLAVTGLLLAAIFSNLYQQKVIHRTATNSRVLGEYQQLNQLALSIERSARNYQANAARDYESYFRDVEVYLGELKGTIAQFDTLVGTIADKTQNEIRDLVPPVLSSLAGSTIDQGTLALAILDLKSSWRRYIDGFDAALGEDKTEPRIEWGTRYVVENISEIEHKLHTLMNQYETYLQQQTRSSEIIFRVYLVLIAMLGLVILVWFYIKIIRPISAIAGACAKVASGDFGYTLSIKGNNELAQLSSAFNTMSSRSEMVLNLIANLQQTRTADEAIATICRSIGTYIPIAWAALLKSDQTNSYLNVVTTLPSASRSQLDNPQVKGNTEFGKQCQDALLTKRGFTNDDLLNTARKNQGDVFVNGLVRRAQIDTIVCIPLYNNAGWEGMLILGSKAGSYNTQHVELLNRLAPLLASHLQKLI